jgi:predicted nuclease of predicted toxin-antitoxin system
MKFLIDMNLSPLWVPFLGAHGFGAIHWSTGRRSAAPDSEILDWAAVGNCIVLTHDLDFDMLLAALRTDAPSVVQVRCPGRPSSLYRRYRCESNPGN